LPLPPIARQGHRRLACLALCLPLAALAEDEPPATKFEGAIGLVSSYSPEFAGADKHSLRLVPAGFIRYGRITISGAGGFTTKRNDDVERGLAAALVDRERLKLSLALRFDNGRRESASDRLAGIGDVDRTLRGRLLLRYEPDDVWTLSTSVSTDLLGRGGGWWADAGISREWRLTPVTQLQLGASMTIAGDNYLQSWYGVTPEQAARSGYVVYTPKEGLRDASVGATLRTEFGPRWGGFVNASMSRQLGPAADSPLVVKPSSWTIGGGLAWRF
jgi:outer membrane scaffolding protein for murein synthesis (MipA/OmpV family)